MTEHFITLSTTEPNNNVGIVKLRHADVNSQAIVAQIVENGQPKSFEGLQPFFCLMAQETTGQGVSEESIVSFDASKGTLSYIASDNALQMVGRNEAYFSFRKQEGVRWIEQFSTRTFHYIVEKSIYSQPFKDSNYWWTFKELNRIFNQYIEDGRTSWEEFVKANREILESIDPGGQVLSELIRSRKPEEANSAYPDLPTRLDKQIGKNTDFRSFESDKSFMTRVYNESAERGLNVKWFGAVGDGVNDDTEAFKDAMSHANKAPLFIPQGTYIINENINLTHSIIGDNALITTTMQGLEYLFTANGLDKISISGITVDCKLSRGAFKLTNIRIANVHDVEIKGYSAEYGWYRTDSAILYDSCEFVFANDVYIHDHGFEYGTAMNTLNRCFTIQGDNTKVVNLTRLTIKKANQGIILSTPNANVILSNSYIENTTDNSLYLLTCTTFKAIGCVFNDYYDESAIVASGDYGFRDCTWMNVPNKVVAIANDTTGLEITDSTILLSTDYSGNVVAFRDNTYVLNSFIFTGNRINVFPKITNTNDIFQFGQITYFNISNNTIKLSRMGAGQRLFSFRNTNEDQKTSGVMNGNYVIPLAGIEAIDGKYIFLKLDKENIDVTLNNNFTANGRIPLEHTKLYVNGNKLLNKIGTATQNHQQHTLFAEDMPISGFYHKGDIIWNTNPARNGIAAWLRLTDGNSNVIKTDWQVLKLSIS